MLCPDLTLIVSQQQEIETRWTAKWTDVQQEHKRFLETLKAQHSAQLAEQRKETESQVAKLKDEMSRRDQDKQQHITLIQMEKKSLQERVTACIGDLEAERRELTRLRQEEMERHLQHKQMVDDLRTEIARLQCDLRVAGLVKC